MSEYRVTVGLEIHAELKTRTKMFCACRNDPDEPTPNKNICPVCVAHPGTLPVINKEAVRKVLLMGSAVGGTLADFTEFDRKNYFYPDIPKGYQLSQYKYPLVSGGSLHGVALTRVHLEEDTARSQHVGEKSLVDFNRAGVPLMELVTEPVIHSAQEAAAFAKELQLLLRYLGAGEANMEKGEMRVEANISIARSDLADSSKVGPLGTKVEVKNLNSFRSVERAIAYEIERQSKVLGAGEAVIQETRGWDEAKQSTFSQRKKESSHDYRYFPDPDLPKLVLRDVPEFSLEALKKDLPELPWQKRERLRTLGFLQEQDIEQLVSNKELSSRFAELEKISTGKEELKVAANLLLNDIVGQRSREPTWKIPSTDFIHKISINYVRGVFSSAQVKSSILTGVMAEVADASALPEIVAKVIAANPQSVADYKAGKEVALQFLVGQGMKESKGSANPQALREAIQKALA